MAELYRRRFPAAPEAVPHARHDVLDTLTQAGLTDPALRSNVAPAVSEATANAVRHAYPPDRTDGHVDVAVARTSDRLTVAVSDEGLGMRSGVPSQGSGLGLSIMTAEAQDVAVESGERGTVVVLRFRL